MSRSSAPANVQSLPTARIPPHSLEAERAVLGSLLLEGERIADAAGGLTPSAFYKDGHRRIFAAMLHLVACRRPVDLLTVTEALKQRSELDEAGGPAALAGLVEEAAIAAHLPTYCAIVREKSTKRELIRLGTELVGGGYEEIDAGVLLEAARDGLRTLEAGPPSSTLLGVGLGDFLAKEIPAHEDLIEGLVSADGNGFIAGEEKLGKTLLALEEGICLAMAEPVCGRFPVAERRRVLFIEEEDPERRAQTRVRALLRGHGIDPDDPARRAELSTWFRIAVWEGFTFEQPAMVRRLDATLASFRPAVVYLDVLRKLTAKDLNKAAEASTILATLDELRRAHGCVFRILHHYRKSQGFRTGRGSQELNGSYVLGAWAESSLFLEPVGRKQGAVKVEIQTKDGGAQPGFALRIESEGPRHAPTVLRLIAEEPKESGAALLREQLVQAVDTLPKMEPVSGKPGVGVKALADALKRSDKTIRQHLKALHEEGLLDIVGKASRQTDLWGRAE